LEREREALAARAESGRVEEYKSRSKNVRISFI